MKKIMIDFGNIPVKHTIEGEPTSLDMRKKLGNRIHQVAGDIGLDDFAHKIYFSDGAIEVPMEFVEPIKSIVKESYVAFVQRAFNELLIVKDE